MDDLNAGDDIAGENVDPDEQIEQMINPMEQILNEVHHPPPPPLLQAPTQQQAPPPQEVVVGLDDSDDEPPGPVEPEFQIPSDANIEQLNLVTWDKVSAERSGKTYPYMPVTMKHEAHAKKLEFYEDSETTDKSYLSDDLVQYKLHQICKYILVRRFFFKFNLSLATAREWGTRPADFRRDLLVWYGSLSGLGTSIRQNARW